MQSNETTTTTCHIYKHVANCVAKRENVESNEENNQSPLTTSTKR